MGHSVLNIDPQLYEYFEFRGAVDRTAEVYCRLCGRVIFEEHEDSISNGMIIAQEHLEKVHALLPTAI